MTNADPQSSRRCDRCKAQTPLSEWKLLVWGENKRWLWEHKPCGYRERVPEKV